MRRRQSIPDRKWLIRNALSRNVCGSRKGTYHTSLAGPISLPFPSSQASSCERMRAWANGQPVEWQTLRRHSNNASGRLAASSVVTFAVRSRLAYIGCLAWGGDASDLHIYAFCCFNFGPLIGAKPQSLIGNIGLPG